MYRVGDSEPSTAAADISVGCVRTAGAKGVPGRREDRGTRTLSALSYRVHLGVDLLRGQPPGWISDSKAGDRRIALWRVCLGDDELRRGTAFGHPSLAAQNRSRVDYYWADLAYSLGGTADCAGGEPLGSEVEFAKIAKITQRAGVEELPRINADDRGSEER